MPDHREAEFELLTKWRHGDSRAGDTLVRRYYGSILRFFELRTRNAEDLTQKTFLAAVEGHETFRGEASFRTYLFVIARRMLFWELSRWQSTGPSALDELAGGAHKTSLSALVSRRQEQQLLLAAIAMLEEADQTMVALYYWEGMRSREIGEVLEIPTSTVTTRLSRARAALRARIERMRGPGRANDALLGDLDAWTRSIADPQQMPGLDAAALQRLLGAITPRRPSGT